MRLSALLLGLPDECGRFVVPACPGWDVHAVVAHLVGIVDDALGGRLSGPPSPEQTGEQVQRNRHTNLATLVAHWGAVVGPFEDVVSAASIWPAAIDIVSHELDIRGALGLR